MAATRGVEEELGSLFDNDMSRVTVSAETAKTTFEEKGSQSFPGLMTRYEFEEIDAEVKGLPSTNFKTLEYEKKKLKQTHHWEVRFAARGFK